MSWLCNIRSWFTVGKTSGTLPGTCVVDGASLLNARGGRANPRDMLGLLHRIVRFAEREKIRIQVVFEGEPLHRAPDGETFQGVTVNYEKTPEARRARVLQLVKSGSSRPAVVSQDPEIIQRVLTSGGDLLQGATFRKAVDNVGDGESRPYAQDRDRRAPPRRRGGRRPNGPGPNNGPAQGTRNEDAPTSSAEAGPVQTEQDDSPTQGNPSVRDLVDLVE
ncbi:MAG: hypothetical protein U1E27_08220 [Kiritimatiellia bacterium]|nr:hypothetical protein [Kiritimatiellia bacterium]